MPFIKNKTTHTAKWLLTSSTLIIHGNSCLTILPKGSQPDLRSYTPYSPTLKTNGYKAHEIGYDSGYEEDEPLYEEIKLEATSNKKPTYTQPKDKDSDLYDNRYKTKDAEAHLYEQIDKLKTHKPAINSPQQNQDDGYSSACETDDQLQQHPIYDQPRRGVQPIYDQPQPGPQPIYDQPQPGPQSIYDQPQRGPQPIYGQPQPRGIQYASEGMICEETTEVLPEATKKEIPNFIPSPTREATQPVKLVDTDLQAHAANVHRHIPKIAELNLLPILTEIQNRVNMFVHARENDNDRLLAEQQKEKLRAIKFKLKQTNAPCLRAVRFYENVNERIDDLIKESQTIKEEDSKALFKEAKRIRKCILETVKETNELIKMLKINSERL